MSKSKPSSKGSKSAKPDLLTKVKDAAVTKPVQTVKAVSKAASKELTKQVSGKESKKDKKSKKVKEPTPEPSDSESSESSGSDSEEEAPKPVASGKANGAKKAAPKEDSSDDSDKAAKAKANESSDDSDSDSDASMAEAAPAAKAASSDDGSSDESSEDEKPAKKAAGAATATKDDAESDSDDDSDSSEDAEDESAAKPNKRKAEDEVEQSAKKSKTEAVDTSKGSNLFVGNLSWNVDEAWLKEVFEEFGELQGVRIVTDRDSGRSKGFGYVEFVNAEDAAKAHAAKSGSDLDGRTLNVDFANARPDKSQQQENRRKSYGDSVGEPSDTLFLGNLSFEVGQEAVTEAFAAHGTILGVRLPTDRETGQPKGFGYVTFASAEEAGAALESMQGAYIEGRPIRLDYSSPRPQNSDSPARGRGGFGGRGDRGGRGGRGRGRGGSFGGRGDRGGRGGRGGSTNRGGFGDFSGRKTNFD